MKKKKNSKQFNKRFRKRFITVKSGIIIVLTVWIILFLGIGGIAQKKKADAYRASISQLEAEISEIKGINKELEDQKKETGTPEFKERVAREKLGLIAKGEYAMKEAVGEPVKEDKSKGD